MKILLVSEGKHEESGALESLVRRIATKTQTCTWDRVSSDQIHIHRGKGQGFVKRAIRWILEARRRGYDALVLVIDEDGRPERLRDLAQAQSEQMLTGSFPRALGVAIREFDAWILADEKALSDVLDCTVQTQPSPEENRDPKADCSILLGARMSQRDFYAKVSQTLDLARLEKRCPKGFGIFASRLRSL